MTTTPITYRTEFAVSGVWYTNALRFTAVKDAVAEATDRFSRWKLPSDWRVVTDDTPQKQPVLDNDPTGGHVSDRYGTVR